jgi:hypothetical protein
MRKEVKNMHKTVIGREGALSVEKLRGERLELLPDRIELHRRHRNRRRRNRHYGGGWDHDGFEYGGSDGCGGDDD